MGALFKRRVNVSVRVREANMFFHDATRQYTGCPKKDKRRVLLFASGARRRHHSEYSQGDKSLSQGTWQFSFMQIALYNYGNASQKYALRIETFIEIRYDIVFSQILVQYIRHWASIFQVGRKTEKRQCHQISKKVSILNDTF